MPLPTEVRSYVSRWSTITEEAEIIRNIYRMFISGRTVNYIAKHLTDKGILTPRGKQKWQSSTVESILTNEKYNTSCDSQENCPLKTDAPSAAIKTY